MDLNERIVWLLFGMAIGFILGYIVRSLRDIKGEVDKIEKLVTKRQNESNEGGFVRNTLLLLVAISLTAYAAFATQRVNNEIRDTQEQQQQTSRCNKNFLKQTIIALNQRTIFVQRQSNANIRLQRAQFKFFTTVLRQPENDLIKFAAFRTYIESQRNFLKVNKHIKRADFSPYPTARELSSCLNK